MAPWGPHLPPWQVYQEQGLCLVTGWGQEMEDKKEKESRDPPGISSCPFLTPQSAASLAPLLVLGRKCRGAQEPSAWRGRRDLRDWEGPPRQAAESLVGTGTQSPCEGNAQVGARKRGFLSRPCPPEDPAAPYQQEGKVWTSLCYR